ncbi:hypothetical protein ANN_18095 [Periplaneta americana]|uniref:Mariner Mos1 transposase n=1 Tax=Periplaneta americana TaxID=6978 RepID=A0ABQ8SMS6_PERAM|nr:hypothetical protein ANN_18095 [Periplaneta americana]
MTTFLDESSLWTKPGLADMNQPNLKRQSNEWKHPGSSRPKKVCPTQSAVKVMFIVVYDNDGVILHHAVPPRQTANADYYCRFLQHHLRPALRRKRRHLVILHDNARSHTTAAVVKDLLRRWQWEILEHPPYSPDMGPCNYDLFVKGGHCGTSTKMDALMVYDTFQTFGKVLTCYGTKIVLQWLKEGKLVINKISQLGPVDPSTNSSYPPYLEAFSSIRNLRTHHAVVIGTHNTLIRLTQN